MTRRRWILFGLLALAIAAAVWVSGPEHDASDDIAAPVTRVARPRESVATPEQHATKIPNENAALSLTQLDRPAMSVSDLNPFVMKSWYVAPPPPPPAPPPKPSAPPLPFTYVGKFEEEGGRWIVYLVKGDQSYAVTKGETFDGMYRFDGIRNGNLVFLYLPLSIKQLLPIGTES